MANNNLTYRTGNIPDKEQLKKVGLASFGAYLPILEPQYQEMLMQSLGNEEKLELLMSASTAFVCEDNSEIVGVAYLVPNGNPWDIFEAEWAYIRMVGVLPAYQGQGIAKTLTQMCLDQAKSTGEKIIALHTSEFMDAARHIYESLGFTVLKEIAPRYGKKYWLYTLNI